jgi:hypothetical protein
MLAVLAASRLRVLVLCTLALSCVDLSWKEGIACDETGHCPDALTCCNGACLGRCAPADAGDGPAVVVCPADPGGCFACMPGCACSCGTVQTTCRLQLGVATCTTAP